MPSVGGTPRKVASVPVDIDHSWAQWSPDSTQLTFAVSRDQDMWIEILLLNNGATRKPPLAHLPRNNFIGSINWSPDKRWLVYSRAYSTVAANSELWVISTSDGKTNRLTDDRKRNWFPAWSPDSRELFFVSDRGGTPDLWRLMIGPDGVATGAPQQVTVGMEMLDVALSADGKKVAYSRGRSIANVFRVPLLANRPATWADGTQLTFDEAETWSIDVSRDGRLALCSDRSGNWDIWTMPAGGGDLQQLTRDPAIDCGPRWRVDGKELVFYSSRSGHREIWILPMSGGAARQVTNDETEKLYPSWSPDGREIAVDGSVDKAIVSAQGTGARSLTGEPLGTPDWSPDGMWVAFTFRQDGKPYIGRAPAAGGKAERLTKNEAVHGRWSPDGTQIYFRGSGAQGNNIWRHSLSSGDERLVADLSGRRGGVDGVSLATDGRYLYFTWGEVQGDIWAADLLRK